MHAVANVATVALPPLPHPSNSTTAEPTEQTYGAWLTDINAKLPGDVRVLARSRAPPQFNADTACERRRYEYLVRSARPLALVASFLGHDVVNLHRSVTRAL
jgi:tRNA U38,U39,U40 pseudouridine synthase TruA